MYVQKIIITGNTIFTSKELSLMTSPYENREITSEELEKLRRDLTMLYVNRGYVNSGVIIPDQEIAAGSIFLQVIEGHLKAIDIENKGLFQPSYISDRISPAAGPPLNLYALQEALQLLQQDPRIKKINAELSPGIQLGEANLMVHLEENPPYKFLLGFNNQKSPSIGSYNGEVYLAHQNLFGLGHIFEGRLSMTEGSADYSFSYLMPVSVRNAVFEVHFRKSTSTVQEEPFTSLDIKSDAYTIGATFIQPLFRSPADELSAGLTLDVRREATFLLDQPFSFTGLEDNVTHATVLRSSLEYVKKGYNQVLAFRSTLNIGLDIFNATISDTAEDGRFVSWIGQAQLIQQFTDSGLTAIFRSAMQLANDTLLPMERFSIGGMTTVRGFRENYLVRDNGGFASIELRHPFIRDILGEARASLAAFVDAGWSWNTRTSTPEPDRIASVGAGLLCTIIKGMNFQFYAGFPLKNRNDNGDDLQDMGLHFNLTYQLF